MSPRITILRPPIVRVCLRYTSRAPRLRPGLTRFYNSSKDSSTPPEIVDPNRDVLPNVAEEAAATANIVESENPEVQQGIPIGEELKHDPETQEDVSKVLGEASTGTEKEHSSGPEEPSTIASSPASPASSDTSPPLPPGAKFPVPPLPLPECSHLKHRYSTIIDQVTNFIMIGGRKAKAQSLMAQVLSNLRTRAAPKSRPGTPLLPGTPELSTLPLDPVQYLQTAIDSVSPLVKISMHKAGGGTKQPVPYPLRLRQRRRFALVWISDAADKKKDQLGFADRFADEVVAVVEGRSSAWEKRSLIHKMAVGARANVVVNPGRSLAPSKIKFPQAVI